MGPTVADGVRTELFTKYGHLLRTLAPKPTRGAGQWLHRLLKWLRIRPLAGCKCDEHRREMDNNGCYWCLTHLRGIRRRLRDEALRRSPHWRYVWPIIAPAVYALILLAIFLAWLSNDCRRRPSCARQQDGPPNSFIFDRIVCINLDRRLDRLLRFRAESWPWPVTRVSAIDGRNEQPPFWWTAGRGAWGCYRSHVQVIQQAIRDDVESLLILEDDAIPVKDFAPRFAQVLEDLPADWDMLYLGGQHRRIDEQPPQRITEHVYRAYSVNRTHAYALSRAGLRKAYLHLVTTGTWQPKHHIDHHLERLHRSGINVYAPDRWLIGQRADKSNIGSGHDHDMFFRDACDCHSPADTGATPLPTVIAVLGQFRGGTSCVAGVLHHLGVSMGHTLKRPGKANPTGFYEARQLAQLCRRSFREPDMTEQNTSADRIQALTHWAAGRGGEMIGAKHPTLCLMVSDMVAAWPLVRFVCVDRDPADSSASIRRLGGWGWPDYAVNQTPQYLRSARDYALRQIDVPILRLAYSDVVADPEATVQQLIDFCDLQPTAEQRAAAIAHIDPALRHL